MHFEVVPGTAPIVENMFSAVVIMAVLTTLVTPLLLKRIYGSMPPDRSLYYASNKFEQKVGRRPVDL